MATREFSLPSGTRVAITAPGFTLEVPEAAPAAAVAAEAEAVEAAGETPADWLAAMAVNGVGPEQIETIPMSVGAAEAAAPAAVLTRRGSPGEHVEIAAQPKPNHTALLMVQRGDIVQWFVPLNAPRVVPPHVGARAALADVAPQPLRFLVPAPMLRPPTPPAGEAVAAAAGIFHSIAKLVHIPIIEDLVDAPIRWLIEHIARVAESKKTEGFKLFDDAGHFPLLSPQDIKNMAAAGRVLFLTHGVFSSIGGAFSDLLGTPTLARLRNEKYGGRIVGWDHWTISKTPFENADEMLTRMAPNMDVDFICHSRGALVMRAALEHPGLSDKRNSRFRNGGVGTALFVAGANQGSQLASFEHVNTLLNVYSAIGHLFGGIALEVVFAVLRVLAHGASTLPSIEALSSDPSNAFVQTLNQQPPISAHALAVAHVNFDPANSPLKELLNLNVDKIFGTANDLVVPFAGAAQFDPNVIVAQDSTFGSSATTPESTIWHTNFFQQPTTQALIATTFL